VIGPGPGVVFWVGMEAVFSAVFSGMVISDDDKYGPITIGVVIILGAVAGIVWHERGLSARRPRVAAGPDR
jgi:membrane protein